MRMTARPIDSARPALGPALPERLPFVALVDNVRSLWNVGSIFRTADACGVSRIVLCGITGCPPRPEIAKTALGAEDHVPWEYQPSALRALGALCGDGWRPVALEATPSAVPLDDVDWPERPCLVLGNEVAGVSPEVRAACALHVAIPMRGAKSSLNVAVAFGIAAYAAAAALAGQRRAVARR